jgi:hypothetical protein
VPHFDISRLNRYLKKLYPAREPLGPSYNRERSKTGIFGCTSLAVHYQVIEGSLVVLQPIELGAEQDVRSQR